MIRAHLVLFLSCAIIALGESKAASVEKPVVVGQTFLAGSTDPTTGSTGWALTSHGISENLFTVNKKGDIVGQVANSVKKVSEKVWDVTLKSGYKFSDGTAVTAQHVVDCLTELNQKNSNAKSSLDVMTVTKQGDLVVRITSTRATHVMDSVLAEYAFVVYKKSGADFVFTGPFAVKKFEANDYIDLIPNTHYDAQVSKRPNIKIKKYSNGQALATAIKAGEADVGFHLPIDAVAGINAKAGLSVKSFEVGYHYMMFHNIRKANMADVRVRKAIDLAIDRAKLAERLGDDTGATSRRLKAGVSGGRGTRSLFPDYTPWFSDDSNGASNVVKAGQLLDEAGWTLSNGKRTKGGQTLNINLVAYPQRPGLPIMQPLIAKSLTDLGINVTSIVTSGSSWDQLDKIIADKSFDLLMWAQNTLPSGDPLFFLNGFFRSTGGNNHAGLNSTNVDSLLDTLSIAEEHTARVAASKAAQAGILDLVPVSNLVTPAWHVGLSTRMAEYEPWGSDYYIIRADLHEVAPSDGAAPSACSTNIALSFAVVLGLFASTLV